MELARRILSPLRRGLEIGGSAANPFPGVRAFNLDHPGGALFRAAQERIAGRALRVDVYGAADRLPLRAGALDFVLASHVIEHMPDTLRALGEWDRALRTGGVAFLIVPHKDRTFDRERPRTELEHHLADFALATSTTTDTMVPTSHYHVWITADFVRLLEHLNRVGFLDWSIEEVEDVDSKAGNGFTVVANKRAVASRPREREPGPIEFHFARLALPFQIPGRSLDRVLHGSELEDPLPLPRGAYHVTPIHAGFPPRAGRTFRAEVGDPIAAPVIEEFRADGSTLSLRGRDLTETTWLEARLADGVVRRVLPDHRDGGLRVNLEGLVLPSGPVPIAAVNPPPGGGRGPERLIDLRGL